MRKMLIFVTSFFLLLAGTSYPIAAQDASTPAFIGKIAYIGVDGNVHVLNAQTNQSLTTDASAELQYRWPTWSTDGRLAYFLLKPSGSSLETDIYISSDGSAAGQLAYAGDGEVITYAYWSPQNCQQGSNCRQLAVLLSDLVTQGFSVRLILDEQGRPSNSLAGTGAPFYYSWSPDGTRMLWQRNNQNLDIYDVSADKLSKTLTQKPGYFQAPAWSPTEDRWLFGALGSDQQSTDLVIVTDDGAVQIVAAHLSGPVTFSWSPDGNRIAYIENSGALFVVDSHSGETIARSSVSGVYAFFWSPDSQQIAYISQAAAPASTIAFAGNTAKLASLVQAPAGIAWSVMNAATGATNRYDAFNPSQETIYLLSFFDQFSQSHRIWSPDSRYLVYGETTGDSHNVITLLDTTQPFTAPISIAEGVIGIWSFN